MAAREQPVLTDGAITLRPWRPDDAEAVCTACQDPDIQRWTQVPHPYQMSDAVSFVAEIAPAAWRDGTGVVFAVVDGADVLLASVGLVGLDREARSGEVGYWVAPQARRRGVASSATVLISRWAGEVFELDRIELYRTREMSRLGRLPREPASGLTAKPSMRSEVAGFACCGTSATSTRTARPVSEAARAPGAGPWYGARYDPACPSPTRTVARTACLPQS